MKYLELFQTFPNQSDFQVSLDGLRDGKTCLLSTTGSPDDQLMIDIEKAALDKGLYIVKSHRKLGKPGRFVQEVTLFILRSMDDAWRTQAYRALTHLKEHHPSYNFVSNDSILVERTMCGVTDSEIELFIRDEARFRIDYRFFTVYLVMSINYKERLVDLGFRCLDPRVEDDLPIVVAFYGKNAAPKVTCMDILPANSILARAGATLRGLESLLDIMDYDEETAAIYGNLQPSQVPLFNSIIETKIQFYDGISWK